MTKCRVSLFVLGLLLLPACGGGGGAAPANSGTGVAEDFSLQEIISTVLDCDPGSGARIRFVAKPLPSINFSLGPPLVIGESETIQSGALPVRVLNFPTGTEAVLVYVEDVVTKGGVVRKAPGYYRFDDFAPAQQSLLTQGARKAGAGPTSEVPLSVVMNPAFAGSFNCKFAVLVGNQISRPFDWPVESKEQAVGDVHVTVTWDTDANLNLHVQDPLGDEIAVTRLKSSPSGGALIDSSTGASTPRSESIGWVTGAAPSGCYRVGVAFARKPASQRPTAFTVTVSRAVGDGSAYTQHFAAGSFPFDTPELEVPFFIFGSDPNLTPFFSADPEVDPFVFDGSTAPAPDGTLCGSWTLTLTRTAGDLDCGGALDATPVTIQQVGAMNEGATVRFVSSANGTLWQGTRNGTGVDVAVPTTFTLEGEEVTVSALSLIVETDSRITGAAVLTSPSCSGTVDLIFSR